jgi:hypothetical protein
MSTVNMKYLISKGIRREDIRRIINEREIGRDVLSGVNVQGTICLVEISLRRRDRKP